MTFDKDTTGLVSKVDQTLELQEETEVTYATFDVKGQPTSKHQLTTKQPLLAWTDDKNVFKPPIHNALTSFTERKVQICKNDLKIKVMRPPPIKNTAKVTDISRYSNKNAKPILANANPFFINQASPFEVN